MPISPEQLAACGTEHAHQAATFQWVATVGAKRWPAMSRLHAIPNGANYGGDRKTGARMRAEGLKSGVPDTFLPHRVHTWPGLYVELKRPGLERGADGGLSESQQDWCRWLAEDGWAVVVAYGWQAACLALVAYETGRPLTEISLARMWGAHFVNQQGDPLDEKLFVCGARPYDSLVEARVGRIG